MLSMQGHIGNAPPPSTTAPSKPESVPQQVQSSTMDTSKRNPDSVINQSVKSIKVDHEPLPSTSKGVSISNITQPPKTVQKSSINSNLKGRTPTTTAVTPGIDLDAEIDLPPVLSSLNLGESADASNFSSATSNSPDKKATSGH